MSIKRLICAFGLSAVLIGTIFGSIVFEAAPIDPLFREFLADPYSNSTSFRPFSVLNEDGVPRGILIADSETNQYVEVPFEDRSYEDNHDFYQLKSAANIGLCRLSVDWFQIEGYLNGGVNTVFQNYGSTDTLGFDGFYGAGVTVRLFDKLAMQFGFHHFSGHWGDETLKSLIEENDDIDWDETRLVEYTRGNSWLASVSFEPNEMIRIYGSAELPKSSAWIRPGVHVPSYTVKPGSTATNQQDYITGQEGVDSTVEYDESYRAWRLQAGSELRLPVRSFGSVFFAGDIQFHQDGQTEHQVDEYSPDNPWEITYSVGGGFEFNQGLLDRKFRLEGYYVNGRFPLLNYFYKRSQYVVFGLAIGG